jgi:glycine reductase
VKIVHYINQFFAGMGGEDAAGAEPERREDSIGPGKRLATLLGDEHSIVATVFCGDNRAASEEGAVARIVDLIEEAEADLVVAGPAFTSGRYGIACGRVAAEMVKRGGRALAVMHEENPGIGEAGAAIVVLSGSTAREMGPALERVAGVVRKIAASEELTAADGVLVKARRQNRFHERNAAQRAVELALARLGGDRAATEIPLQDFGRVEPAAPLENPAEVTIALLTEGALVPAGNPGRLESARAKKWLRYSLEGKDAMAAGEFQSVHGGFSTVAANEDPNRILPLDAARNLEREGRIGHVFDEYFVTAGNGTAVADASRFGVEWAGELRNQGAAAAILTAT